MDAETPEPQGGGELPAGPLARVGARLRAAREARGLSVRDISDQIRIRPALLEALEAGRRDELPADVFVRGFIRSYARCAGVDPDELKTDLERALGAPVHAAAPADRTAEFTPPPSIPALRANKPHPYTVNQRSRGRIAFVLVLLGIVGLIAVTQVSDTETGISQLPETLAPAVPHEPAVAPLPADVADAARAVGAGTEGPEEGVLGEPAADGSGSEAVPAGGASSALTAPPPAQEPAASTPAAVTIPAVTAAPAAEAPKPGAAVPIAAAVKSESQAQPVQVAEQKPEPPKPPRPKVVAGFGTRYVQVSAAGESWVIIYQDGKSVFERLMRAGEVIEYRFDGNAQLTAGNPSVVSVTVDGGPAAPFRKKSSPSRINLQ